MSCLYLPLRVIDITFVLQKVKNGIPKSTVIILEPL